MELHSENITVGTSARAEQLQFLRFLAFLNVFICHAEYWNFLHYPASHSGVFAVSFFIMLSGVVTGFSRYGRETYPSIRNISRDMIHKLRKIYPLYFLVILYNVIGTKVPHRLVMGDTAALWQTAARFLHNTLLLQSLPGIGGPLWFVSTIIFLYLFSLPAVYLIGKLKEHKLRYVIWGGAFLLLMVLTVVYCRLTKNVDLYYWQYVFPPARLGEFIGGILLGYAIRDFRNQKILKMIPKVVYTLLEIAALAFWCFSLNRGGNYWMNHVVSWLIPNTIILVVFLFGMGRISELFRAKPLVYLGDVSFECFILHHSVIQRFLHLNPDGVQTAATQAFSFFYCLILTVVMSALFHNAGKKRKV